MAQDTKISRWLEVAVVLMLLVSLLAVVSPTAADKPDKVVCVNEKNGKVMELPRHAAETVDAKNPNVECTFGGDGTPTPVPTPE